MKTLYIDSMAVVQCSGIEKARLKSSLTLSGTGYSDKELILYEETLNSSILRIPRFHPDVDLMADKSHPIYPIFKIASSITLKPEQEVLEANVLKTLLKTLGVIMKAPTGCLVGDTKIRFNLNKRGAVYSLVDAFHHMSSKKYPTGYCQCGCWKKTKIPTTFAKDKGWKPWVPLDFINGHQTKRRQWGGITQVRSLKDGEIGLHSIESIVESGVKPVYCLELQDGKKLCGTKNHLIFTTIGEIPLGKLTVNSYVLTDPVDTLYPKKAKGIKKSYAYVWNVWHHPFGRKVKTNKEKGGYSIRVPLHVLVYEAWDNKLSLSTYIRMLKNDVGLGGLHFVDPKIYAIRHRDENHKNNDPLNLQKLTHAEHYSLHGTKSAYKNFGTTIPIPIKVKSITYIGKKMTYDIICQDPYRNFSANGMIVHNSGKTVMGIDIISKLSQKTLIVVPTERIFTQWVDQIKKFTDQKEVGVVRGSVCRTKHPITVGMIHTLCKDRLREKLGEEFGLVITDECHTLGAETFSRTASMFNCIYRIGLSATPRRKDGMEKVFEWHIGPVVVNQNIVNAKPRVIMVDYYDTSTTHEGCVWNGDLQLGRYINRVTKCIPRSVMIYKFTKDAFDNGHSVLVLTERLAQVDQLYHWLNKNETTKGKVGRLTGAFKEIDRDIIVGTYGSAGMGLDIPNLSCLILATPRTDIEQAVGRILRKTEYEKTPVVVDITDVCSSIMQSWGRKRKKFYDRNNLEIKYIRKDATNV